MSVGTAPPGAAPPAPSWLRGAGWLALATVVVSTLNYVFSLAMARVLPAGSFVDFVAVQSLLLVAGTGVMSAVPWVVAKQVALARDTPDAPARLRESLHFGIVGSVVQGVPVGLVAAAVGAHLGGWGLGVVAGVAGFALSLVAAPVGFLQGEHRFGAIAALRLGEAVLRVAAGLALAVALAGSPLGALAGFPLGSAALVVVGLLLCRRGFPLRRPRRGTVGALVRQAVWLGGVQVVLSLLGAVDTITAAAAGLNPSEAYAYQLAALLGRVPLFLSVAIAQALYPSLSSAVSAGGLRHELRRGGGLYLRVAALVVVASWTVPPVLLALAAPQGTAEVATLLRVTTVSGLLVGLLNVVTTAHQARSRFRPVLALLVPVAVLQPVALLLAGRHGAVVFALVSAVLLALLTAAVLVQSRDWWWQGVPRLTGAVAARWAAVLVLGVLAAAGGLLVWVPAMAALTLVLGWPYLPGSLRGRIPVHRSTRGGPA
ncbi:hypothetical protein GCM10027047_34890 [Rhodococcus aerolatus]